MRRRKLTKQQQERIRRHANIRRGMRIALYEVQQKLAEYGLGISFPSWFIPYTIAIAEGGRRDATPEDKFEATAWRAIHEMRQRIERLERRAR